MLVDDDSETCLTGMSDHVVELAQPLGVEAIVGTHVPECLQDQADEVEAALPDLGEVPPLEAALADVAPIRIVAKHVYAPVERRRHRRRHRL